MLSYAHESGGGGVDTAKLHVHIGHDTRFALREHVSSRLLRVYIAV